MYSQARSRSSAACSNASRVSQSQTVPLIVPGPGHGTEQVDNVPWMISQALGWLRLSLGTVSPRDTSSPSLEDVLCYTKKDGGEGTGLTGTPGDFAQGSVKGNQPSGQQKTVRSSRNHSHFPSSRSTRCWGEGASFWKSPWQLDLVESPQKMVCFQSPRTSWQRGAGPKTAICCCQGTRNRSLSAANKWVGTQLVLPLGLACLPGCASAGVPGSWVRRGWCFPW